MIPSPEHSQPEFQNLLQKIAQLSVSGRMHLIDAISDTRAGFTRRPLEECTSYRTREFGCYVPETTGEIRKGNFFSFKLPKKDVEKKFKKKELQELLDRQQVSYKKSANRKKLLFLSAKHARPELKTLALTKREFIPNPPLSTCGEELIDFYQRQSDRLAVWAAGAICPFLRGL